MAKKKTTKKKSQQLRGDRQNALEAAQAEKAGSKFEWHFGRITRMGYYQIAGGRGVSILWEEGGITSQVGEIDYDQWEIFKLAFETTGRIAVLSDEEGDEWMYDYRFLEAVR
jgi:hypothetical protein